MKSGTWSLDLRAGAVSEFSITGFGSQVWNVSTAVGHLFEGVVHQAPAAGHRRAREEDTSHAGRRAQGVEFRAQGAGRRALSLGLRAQGSGLRTQDVEFRV